MHCVLAAQTDLQSIVLGKDQGVMASSSANRPGFLFLRLLEGVGVQLGHQ